MSATSLCFGHMCSAYDLGRAFLEALNLPYFSTSGGYICKDSVRFIPGRIGLLMCK